MVGWDKQRSFPHGPGTRGLMRIMSVDECRGPPADTAEGTKVSVGCKRAEQGESKLETGKRDFLVVQWLGLCLPVHGPRFHPRLGSYDPTCLGAKKTKAKAIL